MKNNSSIILLLLSIGLFYTFTNGQYKEVKDLHALANEYQNVLQNVSAIVELRDRLAVAYEALPQADIERVNKILPDNIDTVRLALDLDSMASRYGISIDSIEATVGGNENQGNIVLPSEDGIEKTLVSFSFIANYSNFIRLLSDVERNLRIMDIEELSFQSTESGLYSYEVTVGTHWLK